MYVSTSEIVQKANSIVAQCGTRDPLRIAKDLGIEVMFDGMENTVLDTNFQSALGIFVPVD